MKIELRNVTHNKRLSEETECFAATLWIDGVKAGEVSNRGHGGAHEFRGDHAAWQRLDAYAKTLPEVDLGDDLKMTPDAEWLVSDALGSYLAEREVKRILKDRVVALRDGKLYQTSRYKPAELARFLSQPERLREHMHTDVILNLMTLADAVAAYRKAARG